MMTSLFVNDHSFHGQFSAPTDVFTALRNLWRLCAVCRELSHECYCSRKLLFTRHGMQGVCLRDTIMSHGDRDIRSIILAWLDKHGPFWDANRSHDPDEWFFIVAAQGNEELATDSGVAESTDRVLFSGHEAGLISVAPSEFLFTPVSTGIRNDHAILKSCQLPNFWHETALRVFIEAHAITSTWKQLSEFARRRYTNLLFSEEAFEHLNDVPFSVGLRDRIMVLLGILDQISAGIDATTGALNPIALQLRESHFVGEKALFTDSADWEKRQFKTGLAFQCPLRQRLDIFPWHGKIKMGDQFRIHFAWPKPDITQRLPVVYIGTKITKI